MNFGLRGFGVMAEQTRLRLRAEATSADTTQSTYSIND